MHTRRCGHDMLYLYVGGGVGAQHVVWLDIAVYDAQAV